MATSDLKAPLRQAQGSAAQAAAALAKLAEQQAHLQAQLDGTHELVAALQGVAAKQFAVRCLAPCGCCARAWAEPWRDAMLRCMCVDAHMTAWQ